MKTGRERRTSALGSKWAGVALAACEHLLAEFIASITWDDLPEAVQRKARFCFVDNLGGALAGTMARVSHIGAAYAAETWPGKAATILYQGKRASAAGAAFANGCAANALDVDDSARYAYGHAGAQLFPTALALSEAYGLSGARLLCAMVVGYETAHRLGRLWHASRPVYQACGSWGAVACAATAAHLMSLPPEEVKQALRIAEFYAPQLPMMRDVDHPAMVKHGVEWGALTGILAADLASRGLTAPPGILADPAYQQCSLETSQMPWGVKDYLMVEGVAWKPARYACCGWAHAGVEGARRLVADHQIALDQIDSIRVQGSNSTARLGTRLPSTTEEAQFNLAWPLAAMLVDGEIGPRQMLEGRLADQRIRELALKVEVIATDELEELCRLFEQGDRRGRFASRVTITLKDGSRFHSGLVDGGLRFPQGGWDEARMSDKFRWLAGHVMRLDRADELLAIAWQVDTLPAIGVLVERLIEETNI